jgi:hypothetical protein
MKLGRSTHLHAATKTEDKVKGRLLLDIVVRESAAVFELFAGEDKTLLVGWDALLVLNLGLDVVDSVGGLDLQGDGLSGECLNEDLLRWVSNNSKASWSPATYLHGGCVWQVEEKR